MMTRETVRTWKMCSIHCHHFPIPKVADVEDGDDGDDDDEQVARVETCELLTISSIPFPLWLAGPVAFTPVLSPHLLLHPLLQLGTWWWATSPSFSFWWLWLVEEPQAAGFLSTSFPVSSLSTFNTVLPFLSCVDDYGLLLLPLNKWLLFPLAKWLCRLCSQSNSTWWLLLLVSCSEKFSSRESSTLVPHSLSVDDAGLEWCEHSHFQFRRCWCWWWWRWWWLWWWWWWSQVPLLLLQQQQHELSSSSSSFWCNIQACLKTPLRPVIGWSFKLQPIAGLHPFKI